MFLLGFTKLRFDLMALLLRLASLPALLFVLLVNFCFERTGSLGAVDERFAPRDSLVKVLEEFWFGSVTALSPVKN